MEQIRPELCGYNVILTLLYSSEIRKNIPTESSFLSSVFVLMENINGLDFLIKGKCSMLESPES